MSSEIVGDREAPAAISPTIPSNKNQATTLSKRMPAVEQQISVPPITVYHSTISYDQDQASTSTNATSAMEEEQIRQILQNPALQPGASPGIVSRRGAPAVYPPNVPLSQNQAGTAVEQQNYVPPSNTVYRSTTPSSQNQASTPIIREMHAIDQQNYTAQNRGVEPERRDRAGFFATVLNPDENAAAPARESTDRSFKQRTRTQLDATERSRASLAVARKEADAATSRNPHVVMPDSNRAAAISAEHENRARGLQVEQRIRAEIRATLAKEAERNAAISAEHENSFRGRQVERRYRKGYRTATNATTAMKAERNRAAATSAEREKVDLASEAEQRAQAQRDDIERNQLSLIARAQVHNTSRNPPTVMADANSAVTVSAGREDVEQAFRMGQRARAERNATVAEQNRAVRVLAACKDMQRESEGEQRVQAQAQRDAIERDRAASPNPPISGADVNRAASPLAAAPLAARDEANAAPQDSLLSSPVTTSARAPQLQTLNPSANTPAGTTTTPG